MKFERVLFYCARDNGCLHGYPFKLCYFLIWVQHQRFIGNKCEIHGNGPNLKTAFNPPTVGESCCYYALLVTFRPRSWGGTNCRRVQYIGMTTTWRSVEEKRSTDDGMGRYGQGVKSSFSRPHSYLYLDRERDRVGERQCTIHLYALWLMSSFPPLRHRRRVLRLATSCNHFGLVRFRRWSLVEVILRFVFTPVTE